MEKQTKKAITLLIVTAFSATTLVGLSGCVEETEGVPTSESYERIEIPTQDIASLTSVDTSRIDKAINDLDVRLYNTEACTPCIIDYYQRYYQEWDLKKHVSGNNYQVFFWQDGFKGVLIGFYFRSNVTQSLGYDNVVLTSHAPVWVYQSYREQLSDALGVEI